MTSSDLDYLKSLIRDVPDFPKPGILFKDITPLLQDPKAFKQIIDELGDYLRSKKVDTIVGIESRGFIFGPALAYKLDIGLVPVRKAGKLPYKVLQESYDLEYGQATLEIHEDAIKPGARVVIIDDLLATGGTANAASKLIQRLGGTVVAAAFIVELEFLGGRKHLSDYDVFSLIQY